ncbi:hypothetical protein ABZ851_36835 [Streptomyces sp. NPDC047049]|uniref:hypothetical protein n=1 Tax=Streptomyces sp. NPDC047049 TaxID=3156688 RepID=UPI00340439A5
MNSVVHQIQEAPAWLLAVVAAVTLLTALGMTYAAMGTVARASWRAVVRGRRAARARQAATGERPRTMLATITDSWTLIVGFGGMSVSMWGLWRFAHDGAHLPAVLRIGFVGILDGAELGLFLGLYQAVRAGARHWNEPMRRSHRLAWRLVMVSAVAQIAEAHGWEARAAMGFVPVLSAALIDHRLLSLMSANAVAAGGDQEDTGGQPGPLRLVAVLWRRTWAGLFGRWGLDASGSKTLARRAQVQRAALLTYQHGRAIKAREATKEGTRARRKAERRANKLRLEAQAARQRANVATDDAQRLDYLRELASLDCGEEWAQLSFDDAATVHAFIDRMAIAAHPDLISAEARAKAARRAQQEAEHARDAAERARLQAEEEAEAARLRSVEEVTRAREEAERSVAARDAAERARLQIEEEAEAAQGKIEAASHRLAELTSRQEAAARDEEQARTAADEAEKRREAAARELDALREEYDRVMRAGQEAERARQGAAAETTELRSRLSELNELITAAEATYTAHTNAAADAETRRQEAEKAAQEAQEATRQAEARQREAQAVLDDLRAAVAELQGDDETPLPQPGPDGHLWQSEGKQAAWELYRAARQRGEQPPSAEDLRQAAIGRTREEVSGSRARAWRAEFARVLPRVIAAEQEATAGEHEPSTAEHSRAADRRPQPVTEHAERVRPFPQRTAEQQPSTTEHHRAVNGQPVAV